MNADLVTNINLAALMRFHLQETNAITVGVRQYALELPYGIAELDGTRIVSLDEKPTHTFFVNAGIYAVDPDAVTLMSDRARALRHDRPDRRGAGRRTSGRRVPDPRVLDRHRPARRLPAGRVRPRHDLLFLA